MRFQGVLVCISNYVELVHLEPLLGIGFNLMQSVDQIRESCRSSLQELSVNEYLADQVLQLRSGNYCHE